MKLSDEIAYPGQSAQPGEIVRLAEEYRSASLVLHGTGRRGAPLSRAPFRMVTIHAIELYLNAFLLARGHSAETIRGVQHDLAPRTELATTARLSLRKRTVAHLASIPRSRGFLLTRYDPALTGLSELNRLAAILEELATKVCAAIGDTLTQTGIAKPQR